MTLSRRQKYNTNKKRTTILGIILLLLIIVICALIFILIYYPFPSKEYEQYFSGEHPLIYHGEQIGNAHISNDVVYIPLDCLLQYVDEMVWFDDKSTSIIITTENKVVQMQTDSLTVYVNEEPVQLSLPALQFKDDELYVALNSILDYYPIDFTIMDNKVVWLQDDGEIITYGKIIDEQINENKLRLRTGPSVTTPYTASVSAKEEVFIEQSLAEHYYIRKANGIAGYLSKDYVIKMESEKIIANKQQPEFERPTIDEQINLTWEAVYTKNPDVTSLPTMTGVNVVSPTWFELTDESGTIQNLGSLEYVHWAKDNGYQIWALFSNGFDPELTYGALKDFETRQAIIRQLLHYSQMYHLDGINIDIENVNVEHGRLVTQFVREATPYFHEAGLVVSMDVTFIAEGNWSAFYERDELAKIVDYIIVMAYDEHWSSSPVAGSVASLPWVENNLQRLLQVVPAEQLVLGIPLYTRLWKEIENDGVQEVSSQALSMDQTIEWYEKRQLVPQYDENSEQNYVEYFDEDERAIYKIWLEDELSLLKRVKLVEKYNLAGIASWARYFADEKAWAVIDGATDNSLSKNN